MARYYINILIKLLKWEVPQYYGAEGLFTGITVISVVYVLQLDTTTNCSIRLEDLT